MLYEKLILDHLHRAEPVLFSAHDGRAFTYSQLHELVKEAAEKLSIYGLRKGDRVVIQNDNTPETVILILACVYLELCFVLVPEHESQERIQYIISDSGSRLAVLNHSREFISFPAEDCRAETPCLVYILYTSGSTGQPKGVMAPEAQVIFCIDAINSCLMHNPDDRILCCLPLSFDYGMYQLLMSLSSEASLVLVRNSGAVVQSLPGLLAKHAITVFPAMPAMLNALVQSGLLNRLKPGKLRCITSTGDNFPVELINELSRILPGTQIIPMYGLTECKRVSVMPFGRADKIQEGSCGLPLPGTKVRLGDSGELIISGPNVMAGYWNDDELTERYFFDDPVYGRSLRSGDIFKIDGEGFLYFQGRLKQIIKVDGIRVSGSEIEHDIRRRIDSSIDVKVISLPDSVHGEKIIVCVYSASLSEKEFMNILRELSGDWPSYRRPAGVLWLGCPMPQNSNGKTDTKLLRKMAAENYVYL